MGKEKAAFLLTSFTPDGERFAASSPDGTVKIWDTGTGTLVADWKDQDWDSGVNYSSMSCCFFGKKRKKGQRTLLLALGSSVGDVIVVDVVTSEKKWVNKKCHSGGIAALSFANKGLILYVAGTDGEVSELNSESGESVEKFKVSKGPITSINLSCDEKFLVVGREEPCLFSLPDKKELLKFSSDHGLVQWLAISSGGKAAVSSVLGLKQLQVWSCNHESRSSKIEAVLSMQNHPVMLECRSSCQEKGMVVLSVSETGIAYVWHLDSIPQAGVVPSRIMIKSVRQKADQQKDAKRKCVPIISAKLHNDQGNEHISLLVAYGSPDNLHFKFVEVIDHGEDIHIHLTADGDASIHKATPVLQENKDPSAEEIKGLKNPDLEAVETPSRKRKVKKRAASDLDFSSEPSGTGAVQELSGDIDMVEPTMAEKLASLDLLNDDKSKRSSREESSPTVKPPSADSVNILLKQALHADDHALLLDCLYTRDEKVIVKSVSLLNPADALKLLKALISMLQTRGAVLVCMLPWLRTLLSQHASSIVSQQSSLLILNSLYQLIDSRISTFGSALQLSTCLDYLYAGIPAAEAGEDGVVEPIIYEDKDSEEEESDDAMEVDEESDGLGDVIDAHDSDESEVTSD